MSYIVLYTHKMIKEGVYSANKSKIAMIGTIVLIAFATLFIINNFSSNGVASVVKPSANLELVKQEDIEKMSILLQQDGGLYEQVNKKLEEKGYAFQMLVAVFSEKDIQVKFVLENQEATENAQQEIQSLFFEAVEYSNLDVNSFTLKIGDSNDGSDW